MYRFFLTNHGFFAAVSPAADIMTAVAVARGFGMQVFIRPDCPCRILRGIDNNHAGAFRNELP